MSRRIPASELHLEYDRAYPKELARTCLSIFQELSLLNLASTTYEYLFSDCQERLDLLSRTAPSFFLLVRRAFRREIVLTVARLCDPPRTAGKPNASLRYLLETIGRLGQKDLAEEIERQLAQVSPIVKSIVGQRNKKIAHSDLGVVTGLSEPLPGLQWGELRQVVRGLTDIMNLVERHYRKTETRYDLLIESGGPDHLIFALQQAEQYEREQREKDLGKGPNV